MQSGTDNYLDFYIPQPFFVQKVEKMTGSEQIEKKSVLLVASFASFVTPFMGSSINIALPSIGKEFAMDAILLGWIASAYLLSAAVFLVPFGKIADIYGRKKIFLSGFFIFTIASLICGLSVSGPMLIGARILQGTGSALIFGTGIAIVTAVFPPGERGKALGITVASVYLGLALGPFAGGILTQQFGWRSIFLINVPLGIMVIIVTLWKLKGEWADARGQKLDLPGSILYGLALVAIMYGLSRISHQGGLYFVLSGLAILVIFLLWERKSLNPVLDIKLFYTNATFAFSNLAALLNYSASFASLFLLSLYLQYIKALSPQEAGMVLVAQPITMTIFSPLAGRLSDKIEPRIVASSGMALTTTGLFLLSSLDKSSPLFFIFICLVVLGLGFALFSSPNTNAIMSSVEKNYLAVASGMVGTMRLVGQMLSMGIAMLLFAVIIGEVEITEEYYTPFLKSIDIAYLIFAVLCFLGIFASLARGRLRKKS